MQKERIKGRGKERKTETGNRKNGEEKYSG